MTEQQIKDKAIMQFQLAHTSHDKTGEIEEYNMGQLAARNIWIKACQWLLSKQGEGKGVKCPDCGGNGVISFEIAGCCQNPNEDGSCCNRPIPKEEQVECERCAATGYIQFPSNPPEVKENEEKDWTDEQIAEWEKMEREWEEKHGPIPDFPQGKPEKTAEEILEKHILRKNLARVYTNEDVIAAMKEYASQSSSSLRDALEGMIERAERGVKFYEDTPALVKAKAALNNNNDKKEE